MSDEDRERTPEELARMKRVAPEKRERWRRDQFVDAGMLFEGMTRAERSHIDRVVELEAALHEIVRQCEIANDPQNMTIGLIYQMAIAAIEG
jgi:hypothetical protein